MAIKKLFANEIVTSVSYAKIVDLKSPGVNGGSFVSGAKQTRDLNTIQHDPDSIVKNLNTNQFTLDSGVYIVNAWAISNRVNSNQLTIENITDAITYLGLSESSNSSVSFNAKSFVEAYFSIDALKFFEVQHECQTTKTIDGFGMAGGLNNEIYTSVSILKIG
ncbi:hypothetical protein [Candidatus Uabimicrobium amorphum]|uniref:Uncharacterized protein n=1 Tax=Uabimicrobium amorphum TaxID=2596890 RepID=A0A5S9IMK0_UABAM|nr:hypothetical protein [Candidatus Uabimicrobium amorphum]BBM84474.1 hypothetical protein UABAM_02835 [Candidatus Uabimicrobium amorphum]